MKEMEYLKKGNWDVPVQLKGPAKAFPIGTLVNRLKRCICPQKR